VLGGLRARPNESKPDPVDQPERTAHYDCAMCIAEMQHNTETVPLPPYQHHCSDEAKWRIAGINPLLMADATNSQINSYHTTCYTDKIKLYYDFIISI